MSAVRVLGERMIYDGPAFRLGQVDLVLPDGDELPWDVVRLRRSAWVVLADGQDRVLLVRRYRLVAGRWGWELPGGAVEDGEDPCQTAARELAEQAGYRAGELKPLVSFQPEPHSVDGESIIFAGTSPEPLPGIGPGRDHGRAQWIPAGSVQEMITAGSIWSASTLIGLLGARPPLAPAS